MVEKSILNLVTRIKTKDQEEMEEIEEEADEEGGIEVDPVLLVTLEVTNNHISQLFNSDNR